MLWSTAEKELLLETIDELSRGNTYIAWKYVVEMYNKAALEKGYMLRNYQSCRAIHRRKCVKDAVAAAAEEAKKAAKNPAPAAIPTPKVISLESTPWSEAELKKLEFGTNDLRHTCTKQFNSMPFWDLVATYMQTRPPDECKTMWKKKLQSKDRWTEAEDALMIEQYALYDRRWSRYVIPNRTPGAILQRGFLLIKEGVMGTAREEESDDEAENEVKRLKAAIGDADAQFLDEGAEEEEEGEVEA